MEWKSDKIKHYQVGRKLMVIPTVVTILLIILRLIPSFELSWNILLLIPSCYVGVILIAYLKELLYDKLMKQGTPEWNDFLATLIGGLDGVVFRNRFK